MDIKEAKIAFFGGEPLAVPTLEALKQAGILPALVVCNPDRRAGRGQKLTPPPTKVWAEENKLPVLQPASYQTEIPELTETSWDLFVVVAYNFILPTSALNLPKHGVLNVHPSLLPKLRGASPIRSAIKDDLKEFVGVSIMLMDEQMDSGPLLAKQKYDIPKDSWPIPGPELDSCLAQLGAEMLVTVMSGWLADEITTTPQEHAHATYCKRFKKADAELALNPLELPTGIEAKAALHHIYAWQGIGDSFFVHNDKIVKIKQAERTQDGSLRLLRVTPAGKAEMDFEQYLQIIS